ncbi:MAG: hypothetical protein JNL47_07980 [Bacteroidia bacterium]|nr:hypothetical protein [Bacteroidia bacterium]
MLIPFEQLPGTSRIWIFQSDKKLEHKTIDLILQKAGLFLENWTAHNNELHAGAAVLHHHFLILAVDENKNDASGCSIDKAFRFIQSLEKELNISLLNRLKVAVMNDGEISVVNVSDLRSQLEKGGFSEAGIFNNLIHRKSELDNNWVIPVKNSWLATA